MSTLRIVNQEPDYVRRPGFADATSFAGAWLEKIVAGGHVATLSASGVRMAVVLVAQARSTGPGGQPEASCSTARLSELTGLGRAATFKAISELEQLGLVLRSPPRDGRSTTTYTLGRGSPQVLARLRGGAPPGLPPRAPPDTAHGPAETKETEPPADDGRASSVDPNCPGRAGDSPTAASEHIEIPVHHGGPPGFTGPPAWTPGSTGVDPPVQKRGLQRAKQPSENSETNPQEQTTTTARAPFKSESSAQDVTVVAVALLVAEGFSETDARDLVGLARGRLEQIESAIANAEHLHRAGKLRSRNGYIASAIRAGWPLIPEVEQERIAKVARASKRSIAAAGCCARLVALMAPHQQVWIRERFESPAELIEAGAVDVDALLAAVAGGGPVSERRGMEVIAASLRAWASRQRQSALHITRAGSRSRAHAGSQQDGKEQWSRFGVSGDLVRPDPQDHTAETAGRSQGT